MLGVCTDTCIHTYMSIPPARVKPWQRDKETRSAGDRVHVAGTGPLHTPSSLYLRAAVHRRGQHPPKGSGTNMTVEAT